MPKILIAHGAKLNSSNCSVPLNSKEIPGLRTTLDRVVYFFDSEAVTSETPHAFIYFLTISNLSDSTVTLNGRRWVIRDAEGQLNVIEGEGIVGKTPTLAPGESFSYNSHHALACNAVAEGSFHGINSAGEPIHVRIPAIEMTIPEQDG